MEQKEYGSQYQEHLVEQYKIYVEMADRVSARRQQMNIFYLTLLSALLAIITLFIGSEFSEGMEGGILVGISIMGFFICIIWFINVRSFRQLNSGKFKVIHMIEQKLPFPCYDEEWKLLGKGEDGKKYLQLTRVESYVPILFSVPFLILLAYSLSTLL